MLINIFGCTSANQISFACLRLARKFHIFGGTSVIQINLITFGLLKNSTKTRISQGLEGLKAHRLEAVTSKTLLRLLAFSLFDC